MVLQGDAQNDDELDGNVAADPLFDELIRSLIDGERESNNSDHNDTDNNEEETLDEWSKLVIDRMVARVSDELTQRKIPKRQFVKVL
jgi:hypothetical protein